MIVKLLTIRMRAQELRAWIEKLNSRIARVAETEALVAQLQTYNDVLEECEVTIEDPHAIRYRANISDGVTTVRASIAIAQVRPEEGVVVLVSAYEHEGGNWRTATWRGTPTEVMHEDFPEPADLDHRDLVFYVINLNELPEGDLIPCIAVKPYENEEYDDIPEEAMAHPHRFPDTVQLYAQAALAAAA